MNLSGRRHHLNRYPVKYCFLSIMALCSLIFSSYTKASVEDDIQRLESSLREALIEETTLFAALSEIERRLEDEEQTTVITRHIANDPMVGDLRSRITEKESSLIALLTSFGPRHPDVVQVQVEIRNLREQLTKAESEAQKEVGRELGINPIFQALLLRKLDVELNLSVQTARIAAIKEQLTLLKLGGGESTSVTKKHPSTTIAIKETQLTSDKNNNSNSAANSSDSVKIEKIEDVQDSSLQDSSSKTGSQIILAVMVICLGIPLFIFLKGMNKKSADHPVNSVNNGKKTVVNSAALSKWRNIKSLETSFPEIKPVNFQNVTMDPLLALINDPASSFSDEIRLLRLRLERLPSFSGSVMFGGTSSSAGTTVVISNIAVAFAMAGAKVCLVDADLRHPSIHKYFNMENDEGLVDVMTEGNNPDSFSRSSGVSGLKIITAGSRPPNPSEVLSSLSMKKIVGDLTAIYDLVLFDAPAMAAGAEGPSLSTVISSTVLVSSTEDSEGALSRSLDTLLSLEVFPSAHIVNEGR